MLFHWFATGFKDLVCDQPRPCDLGRCIGNQKARNQWLLPSTNNIRVVVGSGCFDHIDNDGRVRSESDMFRYMCIDRSIKKVVQLHR